MTSKERLIKYLEATLEAVRADESAEGRIQYEWADTSGYFNVDAFVRVGNSEGQGDCMVIQDKLGPNETNA